MEQSDVPSVRRPGLFKRFRASCISFLSIQKLAGDVRSAVIGSLTGYGAGVLGGLTMSVLLASPSVEYTVFVNDNGIGTPAPLFDLAEKEDPKLKLNFSPPGLRRAFVCEHKRVTAQDWKGAALAYLDAYRDCFHVSDHGEDRYAIFANTRSALLEQRAGDFLCKCNGSVGN